MIATYAIPFFYIVGLVVVPLIAALLCRWLMPRKVWRYGALACTLIIWGVVAYGTFVGFRQLRVRHVTYWSRDLPAAFDGYRIVQFSDAHVATMDDYFGDMMVQMVDSINAQHGDAIVFTGDMVNLYDADMLFTPAYVLSRIEQANGVFSVLGNHDYIMYRDISEEQRERERQHLIEIERRPGWHVLLNEHIVIRRGADSIVMAGMENWGKVKRMPRRGDVRKTLEGVSDSAFVVMLQHDPTCWREKILPECHAQLTLSGHTHGGQFSLFGWSPASLVYDEWSGMTYEGSRAINVTTGVGALVPFRLGQPGEIVVITLRRKQ